MEKKLTTRFEDEKKTLQTIKNSFDVKQETFIEKVQSEVDQAITRINEGTETAGRLTTLEARFEEQDQNLT